MELSEINSEVSMEQSDQSKSGEAAGLQNTIRVTGSKSQYESATLEPRENLKCEQCPFETSPRYNLQRHMLSVHITVLEIKSSNVNSVLMQQ